MKELFAYRVQLINKLKTTADEFRAACLASPDPFLPVEAGGWNVHQIAVHVRDVDRMVYGERIRRTVREDNPAFQNFDGDAYAHEHYSPNESLQAVLDEFQHSMDELVIALQSLPTEAWSRVSHHEKLGANLTLQLWAERGLAHLQEHLETVRRLN